MYMHICVLAVCVRVYLCMCMLPECLRVVCMHVCVCVCACVCVCVSVCVGVRVYGWMGGGEQDCICNELIK